MKNLFIILCLFVAIPMMAQIRETAQQTSKQDTVTLHEIVVKGSRPISKIEGDGLITSVHGTILQNLGTATDVLGYIPGIQNSNGSISVIGKGAPVIYLNGRVVRSSLELEQLRADKIKDIKLITNPGARYDGQTNAVIRITTMPNPGDGFALDTRSSVNYRDYFGGKENLALNYRVGNLDIFGNGIWNLQKTKGQAINVQDTWQKTLNSTRMDMSTVNRHQTWDGKLGFNYSIADNHNFGMYYQATAQPDRKNADYRSEFYQDNSLTDRSQTLNREHTDYSDHLVDAYYNGKWGEWEADFAFDALWKRNDESQSISRLNTSANQEISLNDRSRGRMLAGELNMTRDIQRGRLGFGAQYYNSRRSDSFTGDDAYIADNDNRIHEQNVGAYVEVSQNFKWVTARVGLRYEHISSDYYEHDVRLSEQSRAYNEFLPSVNLVFPIQKAMLQVGYSRKYTRPLYAQLSSTVTYVNPYLYESGNPYLKSSFSDNVSLNFRWDWLMVMSSYKHVDGQIITAAMPYNGSETITLFKKENSSNDLHNIQTMASIVPGMIKGIYYPVFTAGVVTQFYTIDYRGSAKKMNRPMAIVQFNNMFQLPGTYILSANLKWRGSGDSENVSMRRSWQIDLSAQKYVGKHWSLSLSANDIFNTARKTGFTIYSGPRRVDMTRFGTSRNFVLTVGYKFNVTKSKYQGTGAAKDERLRL